MKKWKNLKDNFMKNMKKQSKSGQAAESGRRYIYARQLSFLKQAGATIETQSSIEGADNATNGHDGQMNFDESNFEDSNFVSEEEPTPNRPPRYNPSSKKRRNDLESALIDFMQTPIPVPVPSDPSGDRAFFESILPSVKSFTEEQKLNFRCEVLNLIKRMRASQKSGLGTRNAPRGNNREVRRRSSRGASRSGTSSDTQHPHISRPLQIETFSEAIYNDENGTDADDYTEEEYLDSE